MSDRRRILGLLETEKPEVVDRLKKIEEFQAEVDDYELALRGNLTDDRRNAYEFQIRSLKIAIQFQESLIAEINHNAAETQPLKERV